MSNYIIYASLYKHSARTLRILRTGFILNLYGSESNSDNPRSKLRRIQRSGAWRSVSNY